MPSKQSKKLMRSLVEENGGTEHFTELSDVLREECNIAKSTADTYIYDYHEVAIEKNDIGERVVTLTDGSQGTGKKAEDNEIEQEIGKETNDEFHELPVLEDVDHSLVPEGHDDYFPRRMGETGTELGKVVDLDVVGATMSDPDFSTLLIGKHGIGKDKMILHICEKTNRPVVRLVGNDDPDFLSLLVGSYAPGEDGNFSHRKGLLTVAVEKGYTFVIDEFNSLSGKVQTMLNSILEDSDQSELVIPETNEVVEPHPEFNFVATMNPNEIGYAGREQLDAATASRFIPIELPQIREDGEREIIASQTHWKKNCDDLDNLIGSEGVIRGIRARYESGSITTWISTRDVIQIAKMSQKLGSVEAAVEMVLVGRSSPEDKEPIRSVVRNQRW